MRALGLVFALVAASGRSVARADDDDNDDDDGAFVPLPTLAVGAGVGGHRAASASGMGPYAEIAVGSGRWQYLLEGGFATATRTLPLEATTMETGRLLHGGAGVRWLARQFRPDASGGFEMLLVTRLGWQHVTFDDGAEGRPEIAIGFAMQARGYRRLRVAFRVDARVLFTPTQTSATGLALGVGFAWGS